MQRRNFLKSLGITSAWMGASPILSHAVENKKPFVGELVLKGKVQVGGKGIEGVAVTDGKTIVRTDKNGSYEL
jgi:hypothetical protein